MMIDFLNTLVYIFFIKELLYNYSVHEKKENLNELGNVNSKWHGSERGF